MYLCHRLLYKILFGIDSHLYLLNFHPPSSVMTGEVAETANRRAVPDIPFPLSSRSRSCVEPSFDYGAFHRFADCGSASVLSYQDGLDSANSFRLPGNTFPPRASDTASRSCIIRYLTSCGFSCQGTLDENNFIMYYYRLISLSYLLDKKARLKYNYNCTYRFTLKCHLSIIA